MAGEKILIVEDEGIVARETEYRLRDLGYEVCGVVASGVEAINKAEQARPDVLLMDIRLKGKMDGIEAAEQIRSRLGIPVIYVTAHADENTLQRVKRTQPMGYLLKPFNERELHAAIEIAIYKQTTEKSLKERQQLLESTLKSMAAPAQAVIVRESDDGYRAAFENLGIAAFVAGRDSIISFVNEEFEKLSGCPRHQLEGRKSWHELVASEDLSAAREYLTLLLDEPDKAPRRHDLRVVSKDGQITEMRLTATIPADSNRIVFSLVDMRERKWAEEACLESERRYNRILETVQEGIWILDADGNTISVNARMSQMLKYAPDEMLGKRFFLFIDVKNAEEAGRRWQRCKQGTTQEYESEFIDKDGRLVYTKLIGVPMMDDKGTFHGSILSITDVSDQKIAEEKNRISLQAKDIYLKEIHHRVKNNLQVVASLLHLQSRNVSDPEMLAVLLESVERVRSIALIHEQLYKSTDLTHVNFKTYLTSLTRNLFQTYGIREGEVELQITIDERVSLTMDNAIPCGLIVNELVSNALRHAFVEHTGNKVSIELRQNDDGTASLIVSDNGVGLPPHIDSHRPLSLGLQLVNTLVNQLGATMQSTSCEGTVFTVTFA